MAWKKIANLRGPAGYNALGTEPQQDAVAAWLRGSSGATALSRAVTELTGLNPKNFGAVGDGVHDDTDAFEEMLATAIPGQAMIAPPPGSTNEFYRITRTLEITTPSLRLIGQPRDAYSVSIRSEVPGLTLLSVKAAGFVAQSMHFMGVEDIADGGENGAGMTVNGIELFGSEKGDIDALLVGCTFQYMNAGVRIRARNATLQGDMFSHCRTGVIIDGIDPAYHTDPAAVNQNRGNIVAASRFHNVGATTSDAGILITDTAKVLHAIVEDNFFDSWSTNHVRAVGTASAPHEGITFRGNKHTETKGVAYDLTYVQNSQISDASIMGAIAGNYSDDAIRLTSCTNLQVSDISGYRIGKSGIVGVGCSSIDIRNVKLKNVGFDAAAVGDGITFDSTSSNIHLDGVTVEVGDGYGFSGDPTSSSMARCDFRNMTLGRINSGTVTNVGTSAFNTYVEGRRGRLEDVGRKELNTSAGVAKQVATVLTGGNYSSFYLEVEVTGRGSPTPACYLFARRYVLTENGTPTVTTIGADAASGASVSIVASGTHGIQVNVTTTEAVFGSVVVRASAPGAASGTGGRGVTITMS